MDAAGMGNSVRALSAADGFGFGGVGSLFEQRLLPLWDQVLPLNT